MRAARGKPGAGAAGGLRQSLWQMGENRTLSEADAPPHAWSVWRQIIGLSSLPALAREGLFSRGAWSQWGADYVSGLRRNPHTLRVLGLLAPLTDADLRRVNGIARLNHSRIAASARWMAIAFVTLPASTAVTLSELEPKLMARILATKTDFGSLAGFAVLGLVVLYQIACAWRARQVATFIEIAMIDRGLAEPGEAKPA